MKKNILSIFLFLAAASLSAQTSLQWASRYNGVGDNYDKVNAMTKDNTGNIYFTGTSMVVTNNFDLLTIKMNANGDTVWTRTLNGVNNGIDEGVAIAVDATGNVYVAGFTDDGITNDNFVTIKYNGITGDTVWVKKYNNSSADQNDDAVALVLDAAGNIIVTGKSDNDPSTTVNDDYVTIKYDPSGTELWVATFNGSGNATDRPTALGIDGTGAIYVTGRSFGITDDYLTVKYDAQGVQRWAQTYDGGGIDRAAALAIDNLANVIVTGRSNLLGTDDYYTLKYDSAGTALFFVSYNGVGLGTDKPVALRADGGGNIYVTGVSDTDPALAIINYDIVTIRYDPSLVQQWLAIYAGAANNNDSPSDLVVDGGGNVFVTGKTDTDPVITINNDYITVKYNTAGTQQWANNYNGSGNLNDGGNALLIDNSGNCIVTGNSFEINTQRDITTIKYNTGGVQQWIKHYTGLGDISDNANAITADASAAYVAGYTFGVGSGRDMCVVKINSLLGDTAWVRKYNGTANGNDEAIGIGVDATGNVYVGGFAKSVTGTVSIGYDYVVMKYNSTGLFQWSVLYNNTAVNGNDKAVGMAVDAIGNVYITGYSYSGLATGNDIVTIKYNSAGVQQWLASYNGVSNSDDRASAIAIDGAGNVYVTGRSFNGIDDDYVTIMYNNAGAQQWATPYSGGNGNDHSVAIAVDNTGNVYVTGQSAATNLLDDYATVKYNSAGVQQWAQSYNGTGNGIDRANAVTVDNSGNVYVTGQTDTDPSLTIINYDYLTVKYNTGGTQLWNLTYNGTSNTNDVAKAIGVDAGGNIYVTGQSENGASLFPNKDYATIKYSNAGTQLSVGTYNGSGNGSDGATALFIKGSTLYVSGGSWGTGTQKDIVTLKYDTAFITINLIESENIATIIFPNPFTASATVILNNAINQPGYFVMYDVTGREVNRISLNGEKSISIGRNNLNSGIYLYKIYSENKVIGIGKVIVE